MPIEMTETLAMIAEAVGPRLQEDGIHLAGLDIIGEKVVEVNTFSPGGLPDASRFYGVDFIAPVLDAVEHAAQHPQRRQARRRSQASMAALKR